MSDRPTILLVNHWHDDNKGDSAITGGIVRLVRERWPEAHVRVATLHEQTSPAHPTQARHLAASYGIAAEPSFAPTEMGSGTPGTWPAMLRWLARMLLVAAEVVTGRPRRATRRRLRGVDLVIVVGGSNIYDDPDVHPLLSLARLAGVLYPARSAQAIGIPVVLAGHTLGPFPRRVAAAVARHMLGDVQRAALRESTSVEVAHTLAIRNAIVAPDMAFATPAHRTPRVERALAAAGPDGPPPVALVVRTHPHAGTLADEHVAEQVAQAGRRLLDGGHAGALLVVAHTLGPTPIEDDRPAARALHARLEDAGVSARLVLDDFTAEELAALYASCAAVVTVRLHAAILAIAHGTPAYAIAYMTRKTEGVMQDAGLADAWCSYHGAAAGEIAAVLERHMTDGVRHQLITARAGWLRKLRAERDAWRPRNSSE